MRMTGAQVAQNEQDKSSNTGKIIATAAGVGTGTKFATHNAMSDWHSAQAPSAYKAGDNTARDFHTAMSEYHGEKAGKTIVGHAIKAGIAGAKTVARVFKSDEENTMSAFGTEPLIKFFELNKLEKAKLAAALVKVSAIQGVIQSNVDRWDTEEGAAQAVEYLEGDDGLRKAVYLDMYDRGGEELAKSDGDKINWLTEIAQYAEYSLNKSQPSIVDISFRTNASSPGAMNGNSGTPASGASADYGTPTPANVSASATYGKYQSDSAAQPINNSPKVADPDQTTRQGKGMLLAAFKAAIKSKTNPIKINPTSRVDEKYPAPDGTDLDTTKGTSLTRAEEATDLQKSISATIADRLRAHADSISAAVAGGAHGIRDSAGRLNKSGFAASIRGTSHSGVGRHPVTPKSVASPDQSDTVTNPAND